MRKILDDIIFRVESKEVGLDDESLISIKDYMVEDLYNDGWAMRFYNFLIFNINRLDDKFVIDGGRVFVKYKILKDIMKNEVVYDF